MRNTTLILALTLALLPAAYADEPVAAPSATSAPSKDIVETAVEAGSFSTLVAAVRAAGLTSALEGAGPFTVFAPTDAAFAKLPEGTVEHLLRPENRAQLQRILKFHVVPGRVRSSDLLAAPAAETLSGEAVPLRLRVGDANVTRPDVPCSNGVIHVIDAVLLPPAGDRTDPSAVVETILTDAIDRGVPVYNAGNPDECARIYREAARRLVRGEAVADLHRSRLGEVLATHSGGPSEEAWALRRVFDAMLADQAFEPRIEAPLPEGFPGPGPVGRVVLKEYPAYRAARAEGGRAFWMLFGHIQRNEVKMTAPVEMTMDGDLEMEDMAFLYERPTQGEAGEDGVVRVLDLEPRKVLSIGMRGARDRAAIAAARAAIEARLAADGLRAAGSWRMLGYNSPMVPTARRYWELQLPIE